MRSLVKTVLSVLLLIMFFASSCKKYLDKKPDEELLTAESIADLQGLLDNYRQMGVYSYPVELLCDDYYVLSSDWNLTNNNAVTPKNLHLWQRDSATDLYWNGLYTCASVANIVLDELPHIKYGSAEHVQFDNVKGSALFLRAFYFYHLAQMFAKSYIPGTASSDLGIVLRLSSDINDRSRRSSVKETYDQIIKDFKASIPLLPVTPMIKTRPGKPAAYGALARTYLNMKEYDLAGKYADSCLLLYDSLMDYNQLNVSANIPFSQFNKEVIFSTRSEMLTILMTTRARIDSNLYKSYSDNDLRKQAFFKPVPASVGGTGYWFKGDYDGVGLPVVGSSNPNNTFYSFTGIVSDEIYLIKAECHARKNNVPAAMSALNMLLQNRYKSGAFIPLTASDGNAALDIIINERRKELLRRGTRWSDIKRLINEVPLSIIPKRTINNQVFPMTTNGTPYIVLIPQTVISMTGIQQN